MRLEIEQSKAHAVTAQYDHALRHDFPLSPDIYSAAITNFEIIPESAIAQIRSFEGNPEYGSTSAFVQMPNGEQLSQGEFLASYAVVSNKAVLAARAILKNHPTLSQLREHRDLLDQRVAKDKSDHELFKDLLPSSPQPLEHTIALNIVDTYLKRRVIRLARNDSADAITLMGYNLALMNVEHAQHESYLAQLLADRQSQIENHLQTMKKARELADSSQAQERYKSIAKTTHERALLLTLDAKLHQQEYIPPLFVVNDMDNNLGAHNENAKIKPGNILGRTLDELDKVHASPVYQRFPITDDLESHAVLGPMAEALLHLAGSETPVFEDVGAVIELARKNGIDFSILTANMQTVAKGILSRTGQTEPIEIIGAERDYREGFDKPPNLVATLAAHNDAVILFSDDGDKSSAESLQRGFISSKLPYPLEDVVFFASRMPDPDGKAYKLQQMLEAQNIPYAANQMAYTNEGKLIGYQGVQRDIELYLAWKKERLAEGWPEKETSQDHPTQPTESLGRNSEIFSLPEFSRHIVIPRSENEYDGEHIRWDYWIGTASITKDPNGRTIALYKGTDAALKGTAKHNHGVAILHENGRDVILRHKNPVLYPREDHADRYPHGFEDARITKLSNGTYLIISNATNKNKRDKGMFAHKDQRLEGCYAYAHIASDPSDPNTYEPLGQVGPEFYLKNVFVHPQVVQKNGEDHLLLFYRDLPDIQASYISVKNFVRLTQDDAFRNAFWDKELSPSVKAANTVLQPLFSWEAKGDQYFPQGQIAGSGAPVEISYRDASGAEKKAWFFTYNATTGFDAQGNTNDRVIGACLLDYDDPRKVISRSPVPIITPKTDDEINGRYPNITFTIGSEISENGELRVYYTGGDQHLKVAQCSADNMIGYLAQYDEYGRLRGNVRRSTSIGAA